MPAVAVVVEKPDRHPYGRSHGRIKIAATKTNIAYERQKKKP